MKLTTLSASVIAAFAFNATAAPISVSYSDFSDLSDFQLNGVAASTALNTNSDNALRLTNSTNQSSSAFLEDAISLNNESSFSSSFSFLITNNVGRSDTDGQGADGLVFALQTVSNEAGSSGGGMGFHGIANSVGIEFDTWENEEAYISDPSGNHVGIDVGGDIQSVATVNEPTRFNNGIEWNVWVDYDGLADLLDVRYSMSDLRPASASISYNIDLDAVFGANDVFVGFTSGTGSAGGTHDITSFSFNNDYSPIDVTDVPEPNTLAMFALMLVGLGVQKRRNSKA